MWIEGCTNYVVIFKHTWQAFRWKTVSPKVTVFPKAHVRKMASTNKRTKITHCRFCQYALTPNSLSPHTSQGSISRHSTPEIVVLLILFHNYSNAEAYRLEVVSVHCGTQQRFIRPRLYILFDLENKKQHQQKFPSPITFFFFFFP